MEKNPFKWPIAIIGGILIWCTDPFFNIPAALQWPTGNFSALTNWHSDLGRTLPSSRGANTALGASIYNAGQVFQGLAIILFAGGLYIWYMKERWKTYLIIISQIIVLLLGVGLIMNGIYSEDFGQPHSDWSNVIFICIMASEFLFNATLLFHPKFKKPIAYIGFLAGICNLILAFVDIPGFYLLEYIGIYSAEIWLGLIVINMFINEVLSKGK